MATKRAAAARHKDETPEEQRQGMPKTEAYKVLQVAPNAEEALVTKAYWHLATSLRMLAAHDPEAREKLDQLNRAYLVLNPTQTEAPLSKEFQPPAPEETSFLDDFVAWARRVVEQTVARWPGRAPELGILTGTTVWLGYLGLSAGANAAWVVLALAVALVTIWSPWRRDGRA
jgi:hypothetical protein